MTSQPKGKGSRSFSLSAKKRDNVKIGAELHDVTSFVDDHLLGNFFLTLEQPKYFVTSIHSPVIALFRIQNLV